MVNGKKRTDRKSQSVRSILNRNVKNENVQTEAAGKEHEQEKQSSRVTDMSWAAKYLDDDWENKYAVRGGYDTKANADSGSVGNSEPVSVDMMSQTQEFKPVNSDESGDDMKIRDAVTGNTIISSDEFRSAIDKEAEHTESFKIRDAFTDKTIALASDIRDHQEVKDAAMAADLDEDMKDIENIRDFSSKKSLSGTMTHFAAASALGRRHETRSAEQSAKQPARKPDIGSFIVTGAAPDKSGDDSVPKDDLALTRELEKTIVADVSSLTKKERAAKARYDLFEYDDPEYDESDEYGEDYYPEPGESRSSDGYDGYDRSYEEDDRDRRSRRSGKDRYYEEYYDDYYIPVKSPLRFIPLVLVIAICVLGFFTARAICYDNPVNASDYSKFRYTVNEGLTDEVLAQDLLDLGLIENPLVFRLRCVFYDAEYVQGTYELSPCYSTEKIINILSGYKYGDEE